MQKATHGPRSGIYTCQNQFTIYNRRRYRRSLEALISISAAFFDEGSNADAQRKEAPLFIRQKLPVRTFISSKASSRLRLTPPTGLALCAPLGCLVMRLVLVVSDRHTWTSPRHNNPFCALGLRGLSAVTFRDPASSLIFAVCASYIIGLEAWSALYVYKTPRTRPWDRHTPLEIHCHIHSIRHPLLVNTTSPYPTTYSTHQSTCSPASTTSEAAEVAAPPKGAAAIAASH